MNSYAGVRVRNPAVYRDSRNFAAFFCLALLCGLVASSHAQNSPSVWGSLLIIQTNARPLPAVGYKVFLYSKQNGWSRPSYTDGSGRYAHYGVRPDKYLLHIRNYQNKVVWQQDLVVGNGPTQVPQIVLPRT